MKALEDHDDDFWNTDFDSDGDIDADDDIIGDLLYIEYMRDFDENGSSHFSQHQPTGELSPWVIAISALVFLILLMIVCSNSM